MSLTWVVGVFGSIGGCAELSYLRGSQELPDAIEKQTEAQADPLERLPLVMEEARLTALAEHHQRVFPLSAAQLLLFVLLALVSGAAIAGRRGSRNHAVQVVAANAALAFLAYLLLSPVREAVGEAVAKDITVHGAGPLLQVDTAEQAAATWRSLYQWGELLRLLLLEVAVFGGAALALTRQRTKDFFALVEQTLDDPQDRPSGED
ncbi:MAG: hypothetical protein JRI68_21415 [Deltaproteobacteria bacterium]|nr:hypothetical protein [Deltaproteobacteria bacterium]